MKKLKTKLHFNRINMQRKDSRVWTASNSQGCNQAERIVLTRNGEVIAETTFDPAARQPRAYFTVYGTVTYKGKTTIVEV